MYYKFRNLKMLIGSLQLTFYLILQLDNFNYWMKELALDMDWQGWKL